MVTQHKPSISRLKPWQSQKMSQCMKEIWWNLLIAGFCVFHDICHQLMVFAPIVHRLSTCSSHPRQDVHAAVCRARASRAAKNGVPWWLRPDFGQQQGILGQPTGSWTHSTPKFIHFERWDFPWKKPPLFLGYPPLMETPKVACEICSVYKMGSAIFPSANNLKWNWQHR